MKKNDKIQLQRAFKEGRLQEVAPALTLEEQVAVKIKHWRNDPQAFFYEALGVSLTNQQKEATECVRLMIAAKIKQSLKQPMDEAEKLIAGKLGISIHSGKGLGKDFWVAGLTIWLLICFQDFKGIATGPTGKQLEDVYSNEIKMLLKNSPVGLKSFFEIVKGGVYLVEGSKKTESFMSKRTANIKGNLDEQGETLQGYHADYMVNICDEASGLPDGVFKPIESTQTGFCNFSILIGNVTKNTGYFYKSHYDDRDAAAWECIRWNAEESDLEDIKPGLNAQIKRMEAKYGRDSNAFRINVLGLPPRSEDDALIPLEWIQDAVERDIEPDEYDAVVFGVDVGRGNDTSVILVRHGYKVMSIEQNNVPDTMVVAKWVARWMDTLEPDAVCVDSIALGAGVCDRLRELGKPVHDINFSEVPSSRERFRNLRAESYWNLRELFQQRKISIPDDQELVYELSGIKVETWEPKLQLKSKRKQKMEGFSSPNKADSLALSFAVMAETDAAMKSKDVWMQESNTYKERSWMAC